MRGSYIHGVEPEEQRRLALLNRLTNDLFLGFLAAHVGNAVLDVGSGLGIAACQLADSVAGTRVTGVELSGAQIAAAAEHPRVRYVRGEAAALPFADASFDLVYTRYLLEHVARPDAVLREMRRVARSGARVAACENDVTLMRVDPPCAGFESVWSAFQTFQLTLGGDSHVGRRLYRLFRQAGFDDVSLSVQPEVHWHGSAGFVPWLENLVGNINSARAGLVASGLCGASAIDAAIEELRALETNPDASAIFVWNRAIAVR